MRGMVRTVLAAATAGVLAASMAAPARAATTVVSRVGVPAGFDFVGADCGTGDSAGSATHYDGVPGFLVLDAAGSTNQALLSFHVGAFSDVTTWEVSHAEGGSLPGQSVAIISINGGERYLITPLPHTNSFSTVPLLTETYQVFDSSFVLIHDFQSLTDYLVDHPGDAAQSVDLSYGAAPCLGSGLSTGTALDTETIGINGVDTLYDFEGPPFATTATIAAAKPTVKYGGAGTSVSGVLASTQGAIGGAKVQLWAKPAGGSYAKLSTVTADLDGKVSATVKPTRTTTYQWRFTGDADNAACTSAGQQVQVAPKLSLSIDKPRRKLGQAFVASGKVSPKLKGLTISVMRTTTGGDIKVGSGKVAKNGTYSIRVVVHQVGTWSVYAKSASTSAYAGGKSTAWSVVVT